MQKKHSDASRCHPKFVFAPSLPHAVIFAIAQLSCLNLLLIVGVKVSKSVNIWCRYNKKLDGLLFGPLCILISDASDSTEIADIIHLTINKNWLTIHTAWCPWIYQESTYLVAATNFWRKSSKMDECTNKRLVQRQTSPWLMKLDLYSSNKMPVAYLHRPYTWRWYASNASETYVIPI